MYVKIYPIKINDDESQSFPDKKLKYFLLLSILDISQVQLQRLAFNVIFYYNG
jgi:hypothetical protein